MPNVPPKYLPALVGFVLLVATQIALPLMDDGEVSWLVSSTVVLLAFTSLSLAALTMPGRQLVATAAAVFFAAFLVELLGSRTGVPFGEYDYTSALAPRVLDVPLIVPLAWVAMVVPSLELGRLITGNRLLQCAIGGWALMAWDLFLDPMMVDLGYWVWEGNSGWQGIPLSNYLGWFFSGTVMCGIASFIVPITRLSPAKWALIGIYAWMTGFSALGFILPIAFGEPVVGVVGATASLPLVVLAVRRRQRWLQLS